MKIIRSFIKSIPTLLLSVALSLAVWISAVTEEDPVQSRIFPRTIPIERVGQNPALVMLGDVPGQATVTLSAPNSVWNQMLEDSAPVRLWVDLSGVQAGTHTLRVNYQPLIQLVKVANYTPQTVSITLEPLASREFPVTLERRGDPAVGFQADAYALNPEQVLISGPASLVERVNEVRVTLDISQVSDTVNRALDVQVLDANELPVSGVTISPSEVVINQPISQRGGYRNVVVRAVTTGQVGVGYRLTNISVSPPNVTVFSSNPRLVDQLPGFVETSPLDLTNVKDDLEVRLPLNLPDGVDVVGDQTVLVQVGVAAIEGSVTLSSLRIEVQGIDDTLAARISPETVDVILSGPIPVLEQLDDRDVRVYVDLAGVPEGTYQLAPVVDLGMAELQVESILPSSVEVTVGARPRVTPTRPRTATPAPTGIIAPRMTATATPEANQP